MIVDTPMVCIEGRTIVIIRDPDTEEGEPPAWYTLDIEDGEGVDSPSWWKSAAHLRAHHQELAADPHMVDCFPADIALWDTVATVVEKAES